jgi:hypothetical protein
MIFAVYGFFKKSCIFDKKIISLTQGILYILRMELSSCKRVDRNNLTKIRKKNANFVDAYRGTLPL